MLNKKNPREEINCETKRPNGHGIIGIIRTRIIQICLTRLTTVSQTGRISNLFTKQFDPVLYQIVVDGEVNGFCSLRKSSAHILTIEAIGLTGNLQNEILEAVMRFLVKYARTINCYQIVTSADSPEYTSLLRSFGFINLYTDEVLYLDLTPESEKSTTATRQILLTKPPLRKLPNMYATHLNVFSDSPVGESFDPTATRSQTVSNFRGLGAWLVHILIARLGAAVRQNTFVPLFQSCWDPIPLEIEYRGSLIGYCFLLRISPLVVELGIIGILKQKQRGGFGSMALDSIKDYTGEMGAKRLVTGSGCRGTGPFFRKCGFKFGFSAESLCLDVKEHNDSKF